MYTHTHSSFCPSLQTEAQTTLSFSFLHSSPFLPSFSSHRFFWASPKPITSHVCVHTNIFVHLLPLLKCEDILWIYMLMQVFFLSLLCASGELCVSVVACMCTHVCLCVCVHLRCS
ncbi:hypothetical protein XENOCAPTIV_029508 [Xenoophorus captivus]|uniref:Uncharacterized protein n=1 Tax=Xenoophorus captivus TaxID=1517983 RepID=A0ABV0SF96_9TELE